MAVGSLLFRPLCSVARARGAALLDAAGVELAADDSVLHADILHAATAKYHHRVLLEVVPLARDVGSHFHPVREAHTGDLADSGVRLPRRLGGHLGTDAALEGRGIERRPIRERIKSARQRRHFCLRCFIFTPSFGELVDGCHLRKPANAGHLHYIETPREMQITK